MTAEECYERGVDHYNKKAYEAALKAFKKATSMNPPSVMQYMYSNLGEVYFDLGDLENASKTLDLYKESTSALVLKGRIEIEEKDYDGAIKSFEEAIRSDPGNLRLFLWTAYAKYLRVESSNPDSNKYQDEMVAIIRELERANKLSEKQGEKEIRPYILYYLGWFYYKSNDHSTAKERLKDCVSLTPKSLIKPTARDLLGNIWNYEIAPSWWRWWLSAPLYCWLKRIVFALLLSSIFLLLLLHPLITEHCPFITINEYTSTILAAILIFFLLSPSIKSIKTKTIEVELRSPPHSFGHILSPEGML